jgi:hypothetical protein
MTDIRMMTPKNINLRENVVPQPAEQVLAAGGTDLTIYFDSIVLTPREFKQVELLFVLQKDGIVLKDVQPRLVRLSGI